MTTGSMFRLLEKSTEKIDHRAEREKIVQFIRDNTSYYVVSGGSSQTEITIKAERK